MTILFILFFTCIFILLSKITFKELFNPLSIYTFIWGGMLFLYELKLLKYIELNSLAWFCIIVTYIIFFLGSITPFFMYRLNGGFIQNDKREVSVLFANDAKILKRMILVFGIITLTGALYTWYALYIKYGSFTNIFLAANEIYTLRNNAELSAMIPYLGSFSLVGLILAGMYTAYKNKLTIVALLPLLAAIIRDISIFARVGLLISFVLFTCSFFIYKNYLKKLGNQNKKRIFLVFILAFLLIVLSASLVRIFRGSYESYRVAKKELSSFKSGLIISPSIYLYLSAHIGVFSEYLDEDSENNKIGENTLAPVYNFLSKFDLVDRVPFHQKGYFIPMWSNSSTYLRELHADYGPIGLFLIPYLLSFISTILWIKFYCKGNIFNFILLTSITSVIALSFFSLIIRSPDLYFSIIILYLTISLIEKSASRKGKSLNSNSTLQ